MTKPKRVTSTSELEAIFSNFRITMAGLLVLQKFALNMISLGTRKSSPILD